MLRKATVESAILPVAADGDPPRRWERLGGLPSPRPERSIVFRWGVRRGSTAITPLIGSAMWVVLLARLALLPSGFVLRENTNVWCTVQRGMPERGVLRIETVTVHCVLSRPSGMDTNGFFLASSFQDRP